uniref:Immunodominant membrane protein n=1 Tax=Clover proliferation phytoplasma TaxID=35776 RepID=X2CSY1_CLOPP|nr:immunodominant membrane protein [Candidatus Phytoplasma trifolii]
MSKIKDFVQSKNGKITIGVIVAVLALVAILYFCGVFGGGKAVDKKLIESLEKKLELPSESSKYDTEDKVKNLVTDYTKALDNFKAAIEKYNKNAKDNDKISDEAKQHIEAFKTKVEDLKTTNKEAFKEKHNQLKVSEFITKLKEKLPESVKK